MEKDLKMNYPEVISLRLSTDEKRKIDILVQKHNTTRSEFIRTSVNQIINSKPVKS